jgi:hypothetical protein
MLVGLVLAGLLVMFRGAVMMAGSQTMVLGPFCGL